MYKRQLKSSTCKRRLNVYFFINFLLVESLKNLANQQSHSGSNNVINFRNTKQAKNSWPSFGYVKKSRVKKSVSKRVVWCLIPLKIFLFFLSLCHSRNAVRMQQWVETKFRLARFVAVADLRAHVIFLSRQTCVLWTFLIVHNRT